MEVLIDVGDDELRRREHLSDLENSGGHTTMRMLAFLLNVIIRGESDPIEKDTYT